MVLHRIEACFIIFCAAVAASAQTPSAPPVKMGLWETTVTSQMSGFQLPPDVVARLKAMGRSAPGAPHTVVTQGCLTREEWQKSMEDMNRAGNKDCTTTNKDIQPRKFSVDISCKSQQGTVTGHWEMQMIDDEHGHGSGHMKSDSTGPNGQAFSMDMTMDSHFLRSDCGDVKPGDAKIIKQ